MNKEDLITQINKIYQALGTISVRGYNDIKTFGNCLDAILELAKNINSYETDVQDAIKKQFEDAMKSAYEEKEAEYSNNDGVIPLNSSKPKPKRIQKEVNDVGEN